MAGSTNFLYLVVTRDDARVDVARDALRVTGRVHPFRKIAPMNLDQVFGAEWRCTASSPEMSKASQRWRRESGGLITARSADELVENLSHNKQGRAETQWLLGAAGSDTHARRVLFQTMEPMIKTQAQKRWGINRTKYDCDEWFAMCVTAGWIAIGTLAGRDIAWPMMQLRTVLVRELTAMQDLDEVEAVILEPAELSVMTPTRLDAAVELGRLLLEAARNGLITQEEAALVWSTRAGFTSVYQLARDRDLSPGLLLDRRRSAEVRVTHWAAA